MNKAERWLKILLWLFGGPAALAIFPLVMPRSWMGGVHEWLGLGLLPDKPIVEYLARYASAFSAFYGFLLLLLATDVHRYARVITFQAVMVMGLSALGAFLGFRAGMPAWWMIGDVASCWVCCGAMLWLQKRISLAPGISEQPKPVNRS
jgi:hypothetical protein